ncbi:hypothetical protein BsWGS_03040 [Bradybaena similaris]
MGIIIGIITYLKREQAEMEEDKMFDMYMQIKREPFNLYKRERVQQMALYLKQIEEQQAAREKIENWRTLEHMQRFQPCRRHGFRHSSCPDCSKTSPIPEICHGYDEATALAMADGNWPEAGGGTALLCSLTLGVCEPLLTPESIKRVAFPDSPHADGKSFSSGTAGAQMLRSYPCIPTKSAFRHGSFTVHYTESNIPQLKELRPVITSGNECKQYSMNDLPPETNFDSPTMFEKGDIELKDLRNFKYQDVNAVFQQSSASEGLSPTVCDNVSVDTQIIPSPSMGTASPSTTSGACAVLLRQLSYDHECKLSELSVHANLRDNKVDHSEVAMMHSLLGTDGILIAQQPATCTANETNLTDGTQETKIPAELLDETEELFPKPQSVEEKSQEHGDNRRPVDTDVCKQPRVEEHQYQDQPQPHQVRQEIPQTTPPVIIPSTIAWRTPQKCELPLHLFVLTQQQVQHGHVRPQVFVPIPNIPQSVNKDGTAAMCAGSPSSVLPQHPQNVHSPLYGAGKKPNAQGVNISDVAKARQLGLNWKSKTIDKKTPARSQPERRGALFFTQRSLHKDADSSKALNSRKLSRPSAFSRQESLDSHTSRTSEMSENIDSPLIQPSCDIGSGAVLASPSSSVSSNSASPLETSKHAKLLPSLARSHTTETSKLLQE